MYPDDLKYSKEHEWARIEGNIATIGVTHFAQDQLGDVVYVDLPTKGAEVKQYGKMGEIESVKSVSDLFSPVGGRVVEVNTAVTSNPETVNDEPYGAGWLIKVEMSDPSQLDGLLDSAAYQELIADQ